MSETHFLMTMACLACLGLSIHACVPHKSHSSKCHMYPKSHNQKSSCSQQNQLNANTAEIAMIPTQIHYPSPNAPVSSGVPISHLKASDAPRIYYSVPQTMGDSVRVYTKPYGYLRKVRSMEKNQFGSKAKDDITLLPHDVDLRDDVIKSRIRRDGDDATSPTAMHQSMDPTTTPSWQDLLNFFRSKGSSDAIDDQDEDENSWRRPKGTDELRDSQDEPVESVELSESSVELFEQFRERMPRLFQRLQSLRELIADSSSAEEAHYAGIPNPFYEEPYADSEHHSDATDMIGQPKKLNEATSEDLIMNVSSADKSIAATVNHDNVEYSSTFTTTALEDHEITTAKSYP